LIVILLICAPTSPLLRRFL